MQTSASMVSKSSGVSAASSPRSASWSQRERATAIRPTLPSAQRMPLSNASSTSANSCACTVTSTGFRNGSPADSDSRTYRPGTRRTSNRPCPSVFTFATPDGSLAASEVVRSWHRRDHFGFVGGLSGERAQGGELLHDDVPVALVAFEAAAGEQERLPPDEGPVALVHGGRHDEVHLGVLVLEEHEDDAVRSRGALARDDEAGNGHRAPVLQMLEVEARQDLGGEMRPEELERMHTHREARRAIVGQHPLPRGLLGEVGDLRRGLERESQLPLRAAGSHTRRTWSQPEPPEELSPWPSKRIACSGRDQSFQRRPVERCTLRQLDHAAEGARALALLDEALSRPLAAGWVTARGSARGRL